MINKYGWQSLERLKTCHEDLKTIFEEVVKNFDNTILEGHRGQAEQDKAFADGKSKLQWPNGKHNATPSMAVDAIPYPIDWNDFNRINFFAGFVLGTAQRLLDDDKISHRIRWGGDWNGNKQLNKAGELNDLVHFELSPL